MSARSPTDAQHLLGSEWRSPDSDSHRDSTPRRRAGTVGRPAAPRSLPEQIAEEIGDAIVSGKHSPGERLVEADLAEAFGVSRGPVRESLRILERRRLIDLIPRKGAYVRSFSLQSFRELFDVRIAIASMATRSINDTGETSFIEAFARRVDELKSMAVDPAADPIRFAHSMTRAVFSLVRASGNALAADLMSDLANQTAWTTIWRHPLDFRTEARRSLVAASMDDVLSALRRNRPLRAEKLIREILEQNRDFAIEEISRLRDDIARQRAA